MMIRNISEAKAKLSFLLEAVLKGDDVIIAKAGKPIARLVKYSGACRRRVPGSMAGEIRIAADFDVLPDEMAEALGMTEARG